MKLNRDQIRQYYPWITLVLLVLLVGAMDPSFLQPSNLINTAGDVAPLLIMALGMTFVIYIGGIDLSSEAMVNMTTVIATVALMPLGGMTLVACVGLGLVLGALAGTLSVTCKIPTFITTLAVGGVALSIGEFASGERAIYMEAQLRDETFGWMIATTAGIPHELVLALSMLLLALFIERKTTLGRSLKAIGAGEQAAVVAGINVKLCRILAFALSGGFAAFAGLLFAVKLAGGSPVAANGLLLPTIVAVLVGGTALTGGVGGVLYTLAGVLIVAVVRVSMLYLEIPANAQQIFFGIVLMLSIALTIDRSKLGIVK